MKLFYSPTSPYVRKVLAVAHELGLAERIERLSSAAHPINRDRNIIAHNPLGQVPTLLLDDGTVLADSRVICEYLDDLAGGGLFPRSGPPRWRALVDQSTGDGVLAAALLARYESAARPTERQWRDWLEAQLDKAATSLAAIEAVASAFGERVDIDRHPATAVWFARFDERPAMLITRHHV
jgi:glutathione S-transferase